MENINVQIETASIFAGIENLSDQFKKAEKALLELKSRTGPGNDFLGWLSIPDNISKELIRELNLAAGTFKHLDAVVVIGIGGSYLGARAVIDALSHSQLHFVNKNNPTIFYAGQNISEDYLAELIEVLDKLTYGIIVISKSGTTTEPAIAFRILKNHLEKKSGKQEAGKRIIAITSKNHGALKRISTEENYRTFDIPDDVGGRYSVLTPVGLLPIALAGISIDEVIKGAKSMASLCLSDIASEKNPAICYAAIRNALYNSGKKIEILANYSPKLANFAEWWKQLYGESEGKNGFGIFPASILFTTDLHSMGQYIQDGERIIFETVLSVKTSKYKLAIPEDKENYDELNYIAGRRIGEINKMAELGTALAHTDGNVPNIRIEIPELTAFHLGQLIYFFELSCAVSGYMLGVNPFDQPGVEAYKNNMFALLKKPGFEKETAAIYQRIGV